MEYYKHKYKEKQKNKCGHGLVICCQQYRIQMVDACTKVGNMTSWEGGVGAQC
jgi:hypothetical protein